MLKENIFETSNKKNESPYNSECSKEDLEIIARDLGLNVELPREDTEAFNDLIKACNKYMEAVDLQARGLSVSQKFLLDEEKITEKRKKSDEIRRGLHNELCIKLFGTSWNETSGENRDKVSNFAAVVAGKEEYVGQF